MDFGFDGSIKRDLTTLSAPDAFADIVDNPYSGYDYDESRVPWPLLLHFDGDLDQTEIDAIINRLTTTSNEEMIRKQAEQALNALRNIRDTTGALTNTQLSNHIRTLAKVQIGIVRLQLEELDATD